MTAVCRNIGDSEKFNSPISSASSFWALLVYSNPCIIFLKQQPSRTGISSLNYWKLGGRRTEGKLLFDVHCLFSAEMMKVNKISNLVLME